ncbi:unnamed protein product [Cuscuta campestris]|uniref:Uncharacterized protein n=1 Tax=Cuscuta campestris TaxID=132261 RepID=A0A484NIC0_9ASTE|nr:unnamed protein product [Cuscuta campestris]
MAFHGDGSTRERAIPAGDLIQRHVETDLTTGTAVGDSAIHTRGGTNLQTELTAELVSTAGFSDQYSSGGGHRGILTKAQFLKHSPLHDGTSIAPPVCQILLSMIRWQRAIAEHKEEGECGQTYNFVLQ